MYLTLSNNGFFGVCSIFAGLAILCNLVLMVSWTPAALVFYTKHCQGVCCGRPISIDADQKTNTSEDKSQCVQTMTRGFEKMTQLPRLMFEKWLPTAVIKPRFVWTIGLGSCIVVSLMVVFYYPQLKLPDKEQFQLFKGKKKLHYLTTGKGAHQAPKSFH